MQFAHINGVTLHYQTIGLAEGKPLLVFVNSLGTDFRIWRDVVVRLAGEFAILLYDKRGHGLSDVGPTPYAIEDHAADLAALLDRLGATDAIICGISVGGQVALALYGRRPDLVASLILCDTAPKIGTEQSWNSRIATVEANGIGAIADAVLAGWLTAAFQASHAAAFVGFRNMLARQPVAGYLATCAALRDSDLTDIARGIAVPTLCVTGESDKTATPEMVAGLARLIPGARYEIIREAAHLPPIEQPAVFAEIVRAFLALPAMETMSNVRH